MGLRISNLLHCTAFLSFSFLQCKPFLEAGRSYGQMASSIDHIGTKRQDWQWWVPNVSHTSEEILNAQLTAEVTSDLCKLNCVELNQTGLQFRSGAIKS